MVIPSLESHYTSPEALQTLQDGGCLFTFQCRHELDSHQAEMVNSVVNLSAFENETTDNYVPHYEYPSDDEEDEYTFLLARAAYVLVGVDIQALLLERLGRHVGTRVDGGILLERTKRSHPPKEDATVKCKSVLLYMILQEGVVLVTHLTVILQALARHQRVMSFLKRQQ